MMVVDGYHLIFEYKVSYLSISIIFSISSILSLDLSSNARQLVEAVLC